MDTVSVLELLQETAEAVIVPRFRALSGDEVMEKGPGDLVTVADREAEILIADRLRAAYPDALVVGEEATSADPTILNRLDGAEHVFTIDPVDGTKNFVQGSPDHAVMCAEIRSGQITRSWIWQPQHQVAYVAELGAGSWRNGERLSRATPAADLAQVHGATSAPELVGREVGPLPALRRSWACCGVDYPKLAEGAVDFLV
ncbi:MAG: inositol monophosphatase family protein, partial [Cellulomonadaceae bacterium]